MRTQISVSNVLNATLLGTSKTRLTL